MKRLFYIFLLIGFLGNAQHVIKSPTGTVRTRGITYGGASTPTCSDGIQNGDETGVDCGGSCPACPTTPDVTVSVSPTTVTEAAGNVTFTFTLSSTNSTGSGITINYTSNTGTATGGSDFTIPSGTVIIADGQISNTVVIAITDDGAVESSETLILVVSSGSGYNIGSPSSASLTITDNDGAVATCTPDTPVSVTTLAGLTGATPGSTVQINAAIDATGATFAANLVIVAGSNIITGTNINLNGACIHDTGQQIFASTVDFSTLYDGSRLSPDVFGGLSGDAIADDAGISAMINNSQYGGGVLNGVYIKNQETTYSRSGTFNWDMNNATVRTTSGASLSHGSATSNLDKYLMQFTGMTVELSNGEFDGQDLASRLFRLQNPVSINIDNIHIHNYLAPANAYARGVAMKINLYGSTFTGGSITNSIIEDIGATSDGVANNTPYGVSKGFYCEVFDMGSGARTLVMSGNRVENIYGDDAEGMMTAPGWQASYNNQDTNVYFDLDNETYIACQRRAFKINASNFDINNSTIRSATNAPLFSGAQATMLHVFSIRSSSDLEEVRITNNQFEKVGSAANFHLGISDARDVDITGNTFTSDGALDLYDYVSFGNQIDQSGLYDGGLDDVIFTGNTMVNVGIQFQTNFFNVYGTGLTIDNNTMDFDITSFPGSHGGAILWYNLSGALSSEGTTVSNLSIDINLPSGNSLWAALKSRDEPVLGYTLDNVDVVYSGASPTYAFGHFMSDFGSTNTITNCDITTTSGATANGSGAITVDGATQNVNISNSFGTDSAPMTVQ